jgi:dCTP deaminase
MILNDKSIRLFCTDPAFYTENGFHMENGPMIEPFSEGVRAQGRVSWGLTHAGYDLRLGDEVWVYKSTYCEPIDPIRFREDRTGEYHRKLFDVIKLKDGEQFLVPAGGYVLGKSLEYLRIPSHLKGSCTGKSTLARMGIHINTTPIEPGWHGFLVVEIGNHSPLPVVLRCGDGIAQIEFHTLIAPPEVSYAEKDGVYQGQQGIVPARVR